MAILTNLDEVRRWLNTAKPHIVPPWKEEVLLRASPPAGPPLRANPGSSLPPGRGGPAPDFGRNGGLSANRGTNANSRPAEGPDLRAAAATNTSSSTGANPLRRAPSPARRARPPTRSPEPEVQVIASSSSSFAGASHASRAADASVNIPKSRNASFLEPPSKPAARRSEAGGTQPKITDFTRSSPRKNGRAPPKIDHIDLIEDESLDDDPMIDMGLLQLPQAKRTAQAIVSAGPGAFEAPAQKRQRIVTSTQMSGNTTQVAAEFAQESPAAAPAMHPPKPYSAYKQPSPAASAAVPGVPGSPGSVSKGPNSGTAGRSTNHEEDAISQDSDVAALRAYIRACEDKINLLTKCNAVNESTSLSLDAKKLWHEEKFRPKMKHVDRQVAALRAGFSFLEPEPTELSKIDSDTSICRTPPLAVDSSPLKAPTPAFAYPSSIAVDVSRDLTEPQTLLSDSADLLGHDIIHTYHQNQNQNQNDGGTSNGAFPASGAADDAGSAAHAGHAANLAEARRVILARRSNPAPAPTYESIEDADSDDSEDNFGGDFMDGLQSSQQDEIDTDLSGFVAPNDDGDDAESIDDTYAATQAGNHGAATDEDEDDDYVSAASDNDVLAHIRLSQDVADRFGVSYDQPPRPIQVVDDDDDDDDDDDRENSELSDEEDEGNFTTQLNEGRDEVIEISDHDFDDDVLAGLESTPVAQDPAMKAEATAANPHFISDGPNELNDNSLCDDDFDFGDDDEEMLRALGVSRKPEPNPAHRVLPGSEAFIDEVYAVLRDTFSLQEFRSNQLEAVVATLMGKDVFVLIPTGGGKSLCYQLPALVTKGRTKGTTVVISPLISLMQDQIHHLKKRNIRAEMVSSRGSASEKGEVLRALAAGQLDLVYLSPEMVNKAASVRRILTKLYDNNTLARIVVDEAHCVSSWGHDFRPDYQDMKLFKEQFPRVPIMALTATANEKVRLDIVHNLKMSDAVLLKQSFNRTNLFYKVMKKPNNVYEWLRDYILQLQRGRTGIIYCHSKQSCENTSEKLQQYGIKCKFYHAGMDADDRLQVQTDWQENKVQVICATIAFGMGIDKPDVRYVIHIYLPRTLEGYYQETGRAGRDGKNSECIMLYSYKDARSLKGLIEKDKDLSHVTREMHLAKLRQVTQYCENATDCRRRQVLHYFNEIFDAEFCNKMCDNCCSDNVAVTRDVTDHCSQIVKLVQAINQDKVTVIHCQDVYWGSKSSKITSLGHHNNPYHGSGRDLGRGDMERIFFFLSCENALTEYQVVKGGYATSYVKLGPKASQFMNARNRTKLSFPQPKKSTSAASRGTKLAATGNGTGIAGFRYQESFVSAREIRNQEDADTESAATGEPRTRTPSRIVLPPTTFNGEVNDSNQDQIEAAFVELRSLRMLKSSELGYGRPSTLIGDNLLKEMAIKLPTNKRDFAQLKSNTKEQIDHFKYFEKLLIKLSRDRKTGGVSHNGSDANHIAMNSASPYFQQTLSATSKASNAQKNNGKKSGQKKPAKKPPAKSKGGSSNIRPMPI